MSRLYLIRHGETEWNRMQRSQGCSNDIPLSEDGIKQAAAVAEKLKNEKIDMFFSSTLKRAFQTAEIIAGYHGKSVEKCSDFMEINFGKWEGMCFSDIKENYGEIYKVWRNTPHLANVPGAESIICLRERCMKKLMEILNSNMNKNILVVSHGISIKVMISAITGIDIGNLHKIRQDNTAINIFDYNDSAFDIVLINDICHIKEMNLKLSQSFEMK